MEQTAPAIAEYVSALAWGDLTPECLHATRVRIMDTLACAWGALDEEPVTVARRALVRDGVPGSAHLVGGGTATAEVAAFVNSLMSRCLEWNDWSPPTHHASDMVLPLIAVGEEAGRSCSEILVAIVAAAQVFGAMNLTCGLSNKARGWDAGVMLSTATAAAAAKLMGADTEGIRDAVAISVTCGASLRARSAGPLSMWKNGAGPQSAMNAIFAARLAAAGMTGPANPFEGNGGVWAMVTGPFPLTFLPHTNGFYIEQTMTKLVPAQFHAHSMLLALADLREQLPSLAAVESVEIRTYDWAVRGIGSPDRWDPTSREAADHSLPFLAAITLADGGVTLEAYEHQRYLDPQIRQLMNKVVVVEEPAYSAAFPDEFLSLIMVTLDSGTRLTREVTQPPPGHPRNPPTREALTDKFSLLVGRHLSGERMSDLIDRVDRFETLAHPADVMGFRADGPSRQKVPRA